GLVKIRRSPRATLFPYTTLFRSCEVKLADVDRVEVRARNLGAVRRDDLVENPAHPMLLHLAQLGDRYALGLQGFPPCMPVVARLTELAGQDIAGRSLGNHGPGALLRGQRHHELPSEILFGRENSQTGERSRANLAGIRAEESRRDGDGVRR